MPRWVVAPAVVAGLASFAGGALVGAHAKADASPPAATRAVTRACDYRPPRVSARPVVTFHRTRAAGLCR